ncbi:MAG: biotin/lipoyl-binding protein, partial [Planctomycetota bacterium]
MPAIDRLPADGPIDDGFVINNAQVTLIDAVTLPAAVPGVLSSLEVRMGQRVERDNVLANLETSLAQAKCAALRKQAAAARLKADNETDVKYSVAAARARGNERQRARDANHRYRGTVTASEMEKIDLMLQQADFGYDQAVNARRIASAEYESAMAQLDAAEIEKSLHQITAPQPGIVTEILATHWPGL